MENDTVRRIEAQGPGSILEEIARRGAQQMLAEAMEAEVAGFLAQHAEKRDENGHRVVVRNGHMPARELITGIGRIPIEQPRIESVQGRTKTMIREMWQAPSLTEAKDAYDQFCAAWETKYPKAVECLRKDEGSLFSFYSFPAAHWAHLRTSNPIESTYATVRLRTKRTKGCGSRTATLTMVWKLALEAEKTWRRLMGFKLIPLVMERRTFVDGELMEAAA